jgi:hypothetical protein
LSIGEIGDQLRRLIKELPVAHCQAAVDYLDQAIATLAAVTYGSTSAEPAAALEYFAQGREQLVAGQQTLASLEATIEQFIENIGAGGGGATTPASSATNTTKPPTEDLRADDAGGRTGGVGVSAATGKQGVAAALVSEVQRSGHKISPQKVVRIGRERSERVVWVEQGDEDSGLAHMMKPDRVSDFGRYGVAASDIADVVFRAATTGRPVGISGRDRIVYATEHQGRPLLIAVTVSANGYIVGAYPYSDKGKLKPLP